MFGFPLASVANSPMTLLQHVELTASLAKITLTDIPQNFQHLLLKARLRSDRSGQPVDQIALRFNGDSGSNYAYSPVEFTNLSVLCNNVASATSMLSLRCSGPTVAAQSFSPAEVWVDYYSRPDAYKSARMFSSAALPLYGTIGGGEYKSIMPVQSITFISTTGSNFVAGCIVDLIGVAFPSP